MSETGEKDQVWTQNLKFEAKKSGQYWGPRLHDVTARLANRTKFVVPRLNRLKITEVIPIFFLYWPIAW